MFRAKELTGSSPSGYHIAKVGKPYGEDIPKDFKIFRENKILLSIGERAEITVALYKER